MAPAALQAMDLTSLRAVLAELRPELLPSRFEKAQQADGHTLQLGFRTLETRIWLELSWLAEAPRLLAIEPPPRQGDGSTLAQQLQHGLGGLALVSLEQPGWERVVELGLAARPGEAIQRWIVLELMGRHSNLFLLDEQRRVVAAARQVRQQQSRLRPIGTGHLYSPPPPLAGQAPDGHESFASWQRQLTLLPLPLLKALQSAYQGISPALALQLAGDEPGVSEALLAQPVAELSDQQWQALWERWCRWLEAMEQERFSFSPGRCCSYRCWQEQAPPEMHTADCGPHPINHALADLLQRVLLQRRLQQRRQQLRQRLEQLLQREQGQRQQQQSLLDQVENSDALQQQADALLCLAQPSRDQVAEAQALYKRARKLRRSVAAITPRLEQHRQRIDQLEASLTYLEQSPDANHQADLEHLQGLEEEIQGLVENTPRASRTRPRQRTLDAPQPLELHSPGGLRLQVGRNHRQNEWISLRQARRGDLWFHAQECPGSHVVLKGSEASVGEADLQAAADLAAHFSRARGNSRVAVVMVPCEELQRIAGAVPGTVRHRGGEVLWADPGRAAALLTTTPPSLGAEPEP
jgi:predicted ribosome quality control (RQC) complex YloA/Tae2 family protein